MACRGPLTIVGFEPCRPGSRRRRRRPGDRSGPSRTPGGRHARAIHRRVPAVEGVELPQVGDVRVRREDLLDVRVPDLIAGRTADAPSARSRAARERGRHAGPPHVERERRAPAGRALQRDRANMCVERRTAGREPRQRHVDRDRRNTQRRDRRVHFRVRQVGRRTRPPVAGCPCRQLLRTRGGHRRRATTRAGRRARAQVHRAPASSGGADRCAAAARLDAVADVRPDDRVLTECGRSRARTRSRGRRGWVPRQMPECGKRCVRQARRGGGGSHGGSSAGQSKRHPLQGRRRKRGWPGRTWRSRGRRGGGCSYPVCRHRADAALPRIGDSLGTGLRRCSTSVCTCDSLCARGGSRAVAGRSCARPEHGRRADRALFREPIGPPTRRAPAGRSTSCACPPPGTSRREARRAR